MPTPSREDITRSLSPKRLAGYMEVTGGDWEKALALYEWNVIISGAFHELIGYVEVAIRNSMHAELMKDFGGAWYQSEGFRSFVTEERLEDIDKALDRLARLDRDVTPGDVVAGLTFGFWRQLLVARYRPTLWRLCLMRAFPTIQGVDPAPLFRKVGFIHHLRNRIAHHEPIYYRRLDRDYDDCRYVIRAMSPDIEDWVSAQCRVLVVLGGRPDQLGPASLASDA